MLLMSSLTPRSSERPENRQARGIIVHLLRARHSARPWPAGSHLTVPSVLPGTGVRKRMSFHKRKVEHKN